MTSSNSVTLNQQLSQELTRRETEILLLVGSGMSNKEIARHLGLSDGTVKVYVHSIFRKTGAKSRYGLVAQMAARNEARSRDVRQKIEYLRSLWLAAQARPQNPAAPAVRREAEEDWGR
jgi:DNA-binding CsgD family transcriptional regulator